MKEVDSGTCLRVLIISLIVVSMGWQIQLAFHQLWLCIHSSLSWKSGFHIFITLSFLPFIYAGYLFWSRPHLPVVELDIQDLMLMVILICIGILFWWFFASEAIYYPMHTYGDEAFHMSRVKLMNSDFFSWVHYFFSHNASPPAYRSEYMMYPALAYVPVVFWNTFLGHIDSPADQRAFLVVSYLAIVITTYILARFIVKSRLISVLLAVLSISSALLLSYTMSFYIELHYVSVLLFSFWLLALGTEKNSPEVVFTAVFVSSLAPIMRESALGGTIGIVVAAILWHSLHGKSDKVINNFFSSFLYIFAGLLPFSMYYLAKSNYTNWDRTRTSLSYIFHQDYYSLFSYAFIYLGPLFILASFILCVYFKQASQQLHHISAWSRAKKIALIGRGEALYSPQQTSTELDPTKSSYIYVLLAALVGIILELAMQVIFLPGYMPWTRNYLFYYAQFMVLSILCVNYLGQKKVSKNLFLILLLIGGVLINTFIGHNYLKSNKWFHESEFVFDFRPITAYINEHRQQFENQTIYIYWPEHFPTYPENLLPNFIKLIKIPALKAEPLFFPFDRIQSALPKDARYILFYYLKNNAKPQAFHEIPAVIRPRLTYYSYQVLVESVDPWSYGNNGVMLLEKT